MEPKINDYVAYESIDGDVDYGYIIAITDDTIVVADELTLYYELTADSTIIEVKVTQITVLQL